MKKTLLAMALAAGVSSLAWAQTSTPTPSTGGSTTTTTQQTPSTGGTSTTTQQAPSSTTGTSSTGSAAGTSGATGASQMTEQQIKQHLEQQGYSQVQLKDDTASAAKGDWTGTAMKSGKQVQIHVDSTGKVSEQH